MNTSPDDSLREALSHLQTPPCNGAARERALALSTAVLRDGMRARRSPFVAGQPSAGWSRWRWLAAAAACLIAALPWLLPRGPVPTPVPKADVMGAVFGEIETLFPNQLDSVVVSPAGVTVNTSDVPTTTHADQRIRLVLSRAGSEAADVQVVTYSGRRVCVQLPGRELCMTPLLRGDGGVMVVTDTQVFGQDSALPVAGYRIHMSRMKEQAL